MHSIPASLSPRRARRLFAAAAALALVGCAGGAFAAPAADPVAHGRYLVKITGCNDCHTAGYAERGGQVPESEWLTGMPVGFKGPWGTSYATNLRLSLGRMSEEQWLKAARAQRLPPMPWFALRDMSDADLRAIYRYVRSLGAAGKPMPAPVGPGVEPATPYFDWVPKLPATARAAAGAGKPAASR